MTNDVLMEALPSPRKLAKILKISPDQEYLSKGVFRIGKGIKKERMKEKNEMKRMADLLGVDRREARTTKKFLVRFAEVLSLSARKPKAASVLDALKLVILRPEKKPGIVN